MRAQTAVAVKHAASQPLVQMRLVCVDVQVTQLHLALRPHHGRFTREQMRILVLVGEGYGLISRSSDARTERHTYCTVRWYQHALSKAEARVEHATDAVGQWLALIV